MPHTLTLLPAAVIMTGLLTAAAPAALAKTGKVTNKLQFIHAVKKNGSPAPEFDAACKKQLSQPPTKFIGLPVTTTYGINPTTLKMSAVSSFPSPNPPNPMLLSVPLKPLGIAGTYAFGSFAPPQLPSAYAVLFSIDKSFVKSKSTFVIYGPKGKPYNCVISSDRMITTSAEASQFKSE